jgi:hypothetical protein
MKPGILTILTGRNLLSDTASAENESSGFKRQGRH